MMPKGLESIKLINNDIEITLGLFKLFEMVPTNFMRLVQENHSSELMKLDEQLNNWNDAVLKDLGNDENIVVLNKLKSYYYYLKILVNLNEVSGSYGGNTSGAGVDAGATTAKTTKGTAGNGSDGDAGDCANNNKNNNAKNNNNNNNNKKSKLNEACHGFIDVAYTLTFSKSTDINSTNLESLSLSSFNFHMMCLISIIQLKDVTTQDRELHNKLTKLIQIYQLLCLEKLVDPNIALLCKFIKDHVVLKVFIDDFHCYGGSGLGEESLLFGRTGLGNGNGNGVGGVGGVGVGTGDDLKLFSYHLGSGSTTSLFDRKPASMTPSIPPRDATSTSTSTSTSISITGSNSNSAAVAAGAAAAAGGRSDTNGSSSFDLSAFQMPQDSKFSSRGRGVSSTSVPVSIVPAPVARQNTTNGNCNGNGGNGGNGPEKGVKRRKKSVSPSCASASGGGGGFVGSGNSPSNSSVFSAMSSASKDTSISMASCSARRFSVASLNSVSTTSSSCTTASTAAVPSLFASASTAGSTCGSVNGGSGSVNGGEGCVRTAPVPITPDLVALSQKNAKNKKRNIGKRWL
ncbi:unnamed protein product [Ambrosiozyma monospora]|uniref:Unnamed protein product n=1 Tax=Ambrosiozyma monospora TaxID=43982 RepID=A0A9W7DIF9_AMBMO|nr:unnamed protein product [Ambrosiozyma monospora]